MIEKTKILKILKNYLRSIFIDTPLFLHICPTRKCNLNCFYCYQKDNISSDMSYQLFTKILDNLSKLGLSIVSFTGGEPLVWRDIVRAIHYCNSKQLLVQLTTNGILLSEQIIKEYQVAGLDYLMVSIDAVDRSIVSKKTIFNNPQIIDLLNYARSIGITVSVNSVVNNDNYTEILKLANICDSNKIPLSLGIIVDPPNKIDSWDGNNFLISESDSKYCTFLNTILNMKKNGTVIIEPITYFKDYKKFLNGQLTWDCKIAKRSTIQVSPSGEIYLCSKLNELTTLKASELSKKEYSCFKNDLSKRIEKCNKDCYSNCAYNSFYYHTHIFSYLNLMYKTYKNSLFKLPFKPLSMKNYEEYKEINNNYIKRINIEP